MNDLELRTALHRDADLVGEPPADLLDRLARRRRHQRRQRAGVIAVVALVAAGVPLGVSLTARSHAAPATHRTTPSYLPPAIASFFPPPATAAPTTPSNEVTPSDTPATLPPVATPSASGAPPSSEAHNALVLGPDGLGPLTLGMTRSEAEATGLVEPFLNEPNSDQCLWRSRLIGAPAGTGTVLYSNNFGVATVDAYEGVRTPEGIAIGSSLDAVAQAYPNWQPSDHIRRGYVPVPGNSQLVYRIAYADGKVTQLTLQYAHQDCYE